MDSLLTLLQAAKSGTVPAGTPGWVKTLLLSIGGVAGQGVGLFAVAFLDSSFLPLPVINDILVMWLSIQNKPWWAFYSLMATLGSVLGCLVIYSIGRKGGELLLRKRIEAGQLKKIHDWLERNEFLAVVVPSLMPPPTPFKLFVLAAGGFQVRLRYFLTAIFVGRGLRYFALGGLGALFGQQALDYLRNNVLQVSLIAVGLILAGYVISRLASRNSGESAPAK